MKQSSIIKSKSKVSSNNFNFKKYGRSGKWRHVPLSEMLKRFIGTRRVATSLYIARIGFVLDGGEYRLQWFSKLSFDSFVFVVTIELLIIELWISSSVC